MLRNMLDETEMLAAAQAGKFDVSSPATPKTSSLAHLTPDAVELGLTVALPETVSVAMASPAGVGDVLANIPIVGRQEAESDTRSA